MNSLRSNTVNNLKQINYYLGGMSMPWRSYNASSSSYRYGFNNGEKLNEVYGESNYVDLGERGIDTRLGRLNWSIDPRSSEYPWQSPYAYFGNSPIAQLDYNGEGDYYDKKGKHLGSDDKNDNLTYTASKLVMKQREKKDAEGNIVKGENGKAIMESYKVFENASLLNIKHSEFQKQAATIYGESSAYKANGPTEELAKEMGAIAYVHQNNKTAYGTGNEQAQLFKKTSLANQTGKMQLANWAIINAVTGGFDYSYGAKNWDGIEQAMFPDNDKRYSTGAWELHKNTIGWKISNEHYVKWQSYAIAHKISFKAPATSYSVDGVYQRGSRSIKINGGLTGFQSTAVYGGTIFWKSNK